MEIRYETHTSRYLGRKMEFKVYGSKGLPCIALPAEGSRFYDWEERGLTDAAARWIDEGKLMLFCPDSIDAETFYGHEADHLRIMQHERWMCYLTQEFLPHILHYCDQPEAAPLLAGCGLGAAHAVTLYLRNPQLFQGVIALSGLYDTGRFFQDSNDLVFRNDPLKLLGGMPADHQQLALCRKAAPLVLCCGQGESDALQDTRALAAVMREKELPVWADEWGSDVTHDWYWWGKQFSYFLENTVFANN